MRYKIIADSGCDITSEMKKDIHFKTIPLTLRLEDKEYVDDDTLNVKEYVQDMNECKTAPKTSCPSPADFKNEYIGDDESVFVVTLSSKLSGSYQSALLSENLFKEESNNKFIHVFDSLSASVGETLVCKKIKELAESDTSETAIVDQVSLYIHDMKTFFILESLEHLAKAGRLNSLIAKVASILDIKPIMGSNGEGSIRLIEKTRGYKKALNKLVEIIGKEGTHLEDKVLGISHCNCLEKAIIIKEEALKRYNFKDIIIVETAGLSSTYADDGGLVIAF